ncbi:hypothetical protein BG003_005007 [Podila horticola]|nr:hypothetical protein BG003_005007 [Podila horticola]
MSTTDKNVNNKNVNNKNVNNLDVNSNLLIPFHELKGVDGDGVYHGRSDRSTHYVLEQVEDFYKRILRQRKHWLAERKFGTRYFVKKIVSIMERLVLVVGEMLDRADCEIWAYDASVTEMAPESRGCLGVLFKPYFVGDRDYVDSKVIKWRTLRSLMNENGHDCIDVLKVDIEGSEYATFKSIMEDFDVLLFS